MVVPVDVREGRLGLWAGGVENEHVDWPERRRDRADELVDLALVGHISHERLSDAALAADRARDQGRVLVAVEAVDRDGETVPCKPPSNGAAQASRAAGDERDTRFRSYHDASMALGVMVGSVRCLRNGRVESLEPPGGEPLREANGTPFTLHFSPDTVRWRSYVVRKIVRSPGEL